MRTPIELPKHLEELDPTPTVPAGMVRQVREYRLITPLFGGGVEPGVADPVTLIRGTTIRGQLRFWWRATRGGATGPEAASLDDPALLKDMKQREAAIWGAASLPNQPAVSQVQVGVDIQSKGTAVQAYTVGRKPNGHADVQPDRDVPPYASFPLQPEYRTATPGMDTKKVVFDCVFALTLTYPANFRPDVDAALWAWETFGGIGGRTRRGFGALQLNSIDKKSVSGPQPTSVKKYIEDGLHTHVIENARWPQHTPHLLQTMPAMKVVLRPSTKKQWDAIDAWFDLVKALSNFRQDRYESTRNTRHPGRSKWPEPDAIRRFTDRTSPEHAKPRSTLDKFPRAIFGLPIVFHFKDEGAGDPRDTILQGADFERLASPLILRPVACANGEAVGLAFALQLSPQLPGDLTLKDAKTGLEHRRLSTTDVFLSAKDAAGIAPLASKADVLQAFLDIL